MGIAEIRALKENAGRPKEKKIYHIPKVSKKRQEQIKEDKALQLVDKEFYLTIWHASKHVCQNCGCGLGNEMQTVFMHHLLPKKVYPEFRHTPENIMILCQTDHSKAETNLDAVPKVRKRRDEVLKLLIK